MLKEQAEFVPPHMPGSYVGAKPGNPAPRSNPYKTAVKATPPKMTKEQIIEAERNAEKEKNRERKAVREAKMDEWNNETPEPKAKVQRPPPTQVQIAEARKRIDARVFKIKQ